MLVLAIASELFGLLRARRRFGTSIIAATSPIFATMSASEFSPRFCLFGFCVVDSVVGLLRRPRPFDVSFDDGDGDGDCDGVGNESIID